MYGTSTQAAQNAPGTRLRLTPARWVALMIGVPVCLACIVGTGYSLAASIGQGTIPVSYAFPAGAGRVSVSLDGGDVVLRQIRGDRGSITGTGNYSLFRPDISEHYARGVASFGYRCRSLDGNCGFNAAVKIPAGTAVSLSTDGGNLAAYGLTGRASLSTGGGDLTVSQVTGALTLSTDGGNIDATGVASAHVSAGTSGGDIEIVFTQVPTDVTVSTDGGNITIVVPQGNTEYAVNTNTDGGNLTEHILRNDLSLNKITATSSGGDITIQYQSSN